MVVGVREKFGAVSNNPIAIKTMIHLRDHYNQNLQINLIQSGLSKWEWKPEHHLYNALNVYIFQYHDLLPFTTKDKDNNFASTNCAEVYSGGWWFNQSHYSNLNGRNLSADTEEFAIGVLRFEFHGFCTSLRRAKMKIRSTLSNVYRLLHLWKL